MTTKLPHANEMKQVSRGIHKEGAKAIDFPIRNLGRGAEAERKRKASHVSLLEFARVHFQFRDCPGDKPGVKST